MIFNCILSSEHGLLFFGVFLHTRKCFARLLSSDRYVQPLKTMRLSQLFLIVFQMLNSSLLRIKQNRKSIFLCLMVHAAIKQTRIFRHIQVTTRLNQSLTLTKTCLYFGARYWLTMYLHHVEPSQRSCNYIPKQMQTIAL